MLGNPGIPDSRESQSDLQVAHPVPAGGGQWVGGQVLKAMPPYSYSSVCLVITSFAYWLRQLAALIPLIFLS